ncbi:MAG: glycerol-3-phosphate 1-O-acyltransferase PlsY [bacterium]
MWIILAILLAYIFGSIPTGLIIGRHFCGIDLREHGSGNFGATNAVRCLGKILGLTILLLDVLKGLAPVAILPAMFGVTAPSAFQSLLVGAAAICGHVFSCFVNFRGGKGVATTLGVFIAIAPVETLITVVVGVVIIALTGYVSAASVTGAILLPVLLYYYKQSALVLVMALVISIIVLVRHKGNIERLMAGNEKKFFGCGADLADSEPIPTVGIPSDPTAA